jgi:hypothetical protein
MPLDDIILLSQLDETTPDGDLVEIAELDDHLRQLKGFLKQYLAVAHDDRGALLQENKELTFADIGGDLDGNKIEAGGVSSTQFSNKIEDAAAVNRTNIADNAIGADELDTGAVTETKIAAGAVTTEKIAAGAITTALLSGTIAAANLPALA